MTHPVVIAMPGNEAIAQQLIRALPGEAGTIEIRPFPDGETYLRFLTNLRGRSLAIICTLVRPNDKFLPLIFAAATARELGAAKVGLVAPYLGYMRQDQSFKPGEAVTSRQFAGLLSNAFDWLVTVDPHLHRYRSLDGIYGIATRVVHAAPAISRWVRENVSNAVIIGPDQESEQWVAEIAREAAVPFTVLDKTRRGDRDVTISVKDWGSVLGRSPVLVDDIISSGRTMLEAIRVLRERQLPPPVCIAVHGVFADQADLLLAKEGVRVITSNSIIHSSNVIDVAAPLAIPVRELSGAGRK